jgi:hypothetical protein
MFVLFAALAVATLVPLNPAGAVSHNAPVAPCSDGTLAPGTYSSITVDSGLCTFLPGVFQINGSLTIAPESGVDATNCDTHVTVTGGISVQGGILGLGGSVNGTGCEADTGDVVRNGIRANNAAAVIIHGTAISGGLSIVGGGVTTDCEVGIPFFGPTFFDLEDSSVNGGVTVTGLTTCWFGAIRNHINGGMRDTNNTFGDPDANEVQTNTINGPLICNGNSPAVQQGDSEGLVNIVTGPKVGECAKPGI